MIPRRIGAACIGVAIAMIVGWAGLFGNDGGDGGSGSLLLAGAFLGAGIALMVYGYRKG